MKYLIILVLFLVGCAGNHIRPELSADIAYQKDLKLDVSVWLDDDWKETKTINGMGVVRKATGYKVKVYAPGDVDMMTILSCHREWKTPSPKRKGGWFQKKFYEFKVFPTQEIEVQRACPMEIGVYEKDKGRHGWGLIVPENERENMMATVKCNGETIVYGGTSVCQAKKGLMQKIEFEKRVVATQMAGCGIQVPDDKKNWSFIMPPGECVIFFVDEKNPNNVHKLVTYGYDVIPIRGVE